VDGDELRPLIIAETGYQGLGRQKNDVFPLLRFNNASRSQQIKQQDKIACCVSQCTYFEVRSILLPRGRV